MPRGCFDASRDSRSSSCIVSIAEQRPREGRLHGPVAPADFYDWRRDSKSFAAMAASEPVALNLSGSGEPERLRAIWATPGFLDGLGIAPRVDASFAPRKRRQASIG